MLRSGFQKRIEDSEAQIKYLENLSSGERRAYVIQERNSQNRSDRIFITFWAILGLSFSALIISLWLFIYKMSVMSSFGIVGGTILNILGFRYAKTNRIKSISKLQFDDFTDEDVLAYLRERRESNRKELEAWNKKGRYYALVFLGIIFLLFYIYSTREFVVMLVGSTLGLLLIGFVVFSLIEQGKYRKM